MSEQKQKDELTSASINAKTGVGTAQVNAEVAPVANDLIRANANAASQESNDLKEATAENAIRPGALDALKAYKAKGLQTPRLPFSGKIDFDKINADLAPVDRATLENATLSKQTPADDYVVKKVLDEALKKNISASKIVDANGRLLPGAADMVAAAPAIPDPAKDVENLNALSGAIASEGRLKQAREYVNDPALRVVGPSHWTGSKANQWATQFAKGFGVATERAKRQDTLERDLASGVLDTIRSFSGTGVGRILASEVDIMKDTQPHVSSTQTEWNQWLDKSDALLKNLKAIRRSQLTPDQQAQFDSGKLLSQPLTTSVAPVVPPTQAPGRPPGVNGQGFVPQNDPHYAVYSKVAVPAVTTTALRRLQPGQPFYDYKGLLRIWNPKD